MPTFDWVAAGSMPRSVSSALARMAARWAPFGALRVARIALGEMPLHRLDQRGVGLERLVHRPLVARAEGALDFGGNVIAPAAVQPVGVRNVARGLLEVRHQAAPLEDLGEDVRDVLARDVGPAELRDRVVAVLVEDSCVELLGALHADAGALRRRASPCCRRTRRGTAGAATSRTGNSARTARLSPFPAGSSARRHGCRGW